MPRWTRTRSIILPAVLSLVLAGCAGTGDDSSVAAGGDAGPTVTIDQPADGAAISLPFTLVVSSSEELGPTESGNHHVHIYFDGNDTAYEVIEAGNGEPHQIGPDSPAVAGLQPGEHTMDVSLRNADHSPAGAEAEITVTLTGSETGAPVSPSAASPDTSAAGAPGYGNGY